MGPLRVKIGFDPAAEGLLGQIRDALIQISRTGEKIVTAIDDLNAAQTALDTEIAAVLAGLVTLANEITTLAAQVAAGLSSGDSAAIESVVSDLQAKTASLTSGLATALATIPASPAAQAPAPAAS